MQEQNCFLSFSGAFGKRFAKYGPDTPRRPGFSPPIMRKNEREDPP